MLPVHEGEIVIKEKYGSMPKERYYVKPADQHNIVILNESAGFSNVVSCFTKIFLPQGYPDSVSKDYMPYQIWDTAQAFCSTITGILATQEVLRGVGVGDTNATPLAATITWVIKDGCGHIGRILFAYTHGTYLDAYSKKWRLYADTLNDAAMCIEIALPMFRNYTTFALCISTGMKAIVGVAGGATRVAMTQHHAIRGNMADVAAKDAAQETAVNLVASLTALLIITVFGNSLIIFIIMITLHISFNYFAVRAVCLKTLNEPRFLQVIDMYIKKEVIAAPCEINLTEPIIFYHLGTNILALKIAGFYIKMGSSIQNVVKKNPKAAALREIKEVYAERNYILLPDTARRRMYVLIKEEAAADDVLCAYFHAVLLSVVTCAINDDASFPTDNGELRPFAQVCRTLQAAEWSREPLDAARHGDFVYGPSVDLVRYVDGVVNREWHRTKAGLIQTGWDLSKHLLMVDEWRISSDKLPAVPISDDKLVPSESVLNRAKLSQALQLSEIDDIQSDNTAGFTIEPEEDIQKVRKPSKLRLEVARPTSHAVILSATEVTPEIVKIEKKE